MKAPREVLIDIAYGYIVPNALHAVARLDIADQLVDGPKTADEIDANLGLDAPSLERVLNLLAKQGVFTVDGEERFGLTPLSELLVSRAEGSVKDLMVFCGK